MKKFLSFVFTALFSLSTFAQFNGDGFYRIKNRDTGRYLTVVDNRASVSMATTEPDLAAILPIRNFDRIVGNPASIIYIDHVSDNNYSLRAQNVDTYDLMEVYLNLVKRSDGTYFAYASSQGMTKYLCDEMSGLDEGWLMTGTANRNWHIIPVSSSSENYFAAVPEFEAEGEHYTTMYAAFPFKTTNDNMKMYYVGLIKDNIAVLKEVEDGFVPMATPVIIKCASANRVDNKLDVVSTGGSSVETNLLGGVYFDNDNKKHWNRVAYDPNTMRVLGKTKDGSLGFITADLDYLPANKAYLNVPAGSAEEIKVITEEEYVTSIDDVKSSENDNFVYYDLSGRIVSSPRNGVYISSNGGKFCK